jgi:hypothetical protein
VFIFVCSEGGNPTSKRGLVEKKGKGKDGKRKLLHIGYRIPKGNEDVGTWDRAPGHYAEISQRENQPGSIRCMSAPSDESPCERTGTSAIVASRVTIDPDLVANVRVAVRGDRASGQGYIEDGQGKTDMSTSLSACRAALHAAWKAWSTLMASLADVSKLAAPSPSQLFTPCSRTAGQTHYGMLPLD